MKLIEVNPSKLSDRNDRACAKLARIARGDTYFGGAKALAIAKRLEKMGSNLPLQEIVGDVYSRSNLDLGQWGAYECPECGSVHLGRTNACNCCSTESAEFEAQNDLD
jgi:rubrerythrin